jgi:hypothetical protein
MATEVCRTYVSCDDGETYLVDTIEHEDALWLVPKWFATKYPSMRQPMRIVRLPKDGLLDLGEPPGTPLRLRKLDGLMPKAVLDGASKEGWPLDVVEAPELWVRR